LQNNCPRAEPGIRNKPLGLFIQNSGYSWTDVVNKQTGKTKI